MKLRKILIPVCLGAVVLLIQSCVVLDLLRPESPLESRFRNIKEGMSIKEVEETIGFGVDQRVGKGWGNEFGLFVYGDGEVIIWLQLNSSFAQIIGNRTSLPR
jgi:hypothetical protein